MSFAGFHSPGWFSELPLIHLYSHPPLATKLKWLESLKLLPLRKQVYVHVPLNSLSNTKRGAWTRWSLRDLLARTYSSFKNTSITDYLKSNLEKGTFHTNALGFLTHGG